MLVGAGDIGVITHCDAEKTGKLLDAIFATPREGLIFTAGDNSNDSGTASQFRACFDHSWGRHKALIRPTPGNHDYRTKNAKPYYQYFGAVAGDADKGYYSYELGGWHVVVLNGNCKKVGGCEQGSAQEQWLREDLRAHPAKCTLAYWHQPLFSSGEHHGEPQLRPLWQDLYEAGAELVVNGHDHDYERFAPQTPTGEPDAARGIREFVVGTGGAPQRVFEHEVKPNSEVRHYGTFGVLELTLHATSYDWQFVPAEGATFTDRGTTACHD